MFDWFWKRVFSDKNVGYLFEKAQPHVNQYLFDTAKDLTLKLIEDEEFNSWLCLMGDTYYARYTKKFWSSIGGKQKGLNYAVDRAIGEVNPLAEIIDEDGNFSIGNAIKMFITGQFKGLGGAPRNAAQLASSTVQGAPLMKRLSSE